MALLISFDLLLYVSCYPRKYARTLCWLIGLRFEQQRLVAILPDGRTLHRVCLARTRLPVGEEAHIHSVECSLYEWFYFFEY